MEISTEDCIGCAPRVDRKSCHRRAIFPIKLKSRPVHRYNSFKILYTMLYNLASDWKRVISSSCIIEIISIYETQILTFCILFFYGILWNRYFLSVSG